MKSSISSSEFYVEGMHCSACELLIEKKLSKVDGIEKVDAKLNSGKVYLQVTKNLHAKDLSKFVEDDGYRIIENIKAKHQINWKELKTAFLITFFVVSLFLIIQKLGIVNLASASTITLPFVFLIGIIASLSTCMAVVGGLVLSISSGYSKEHKFKPLVVFHISRLVSFFLLGGLIGILGSAFILTPATSFILSLLLFAVMLIMGINLLDIFPWAKKLQIKMPKFLGRNVMKLQDKQNFITPLLLGAATFVLPCGFTQSMQIFSLSTGSFLNGAITMLVFALGTLPVLGLIGVVSAKISKTLQSGVFFKTAGLIIIFFALFNFLAALISIGIVPPIFNF